MLTGEAWVETFTEPRALVDNPRFARQRRKALKRLDLSTIDAPIVDLIRAFAEIPCCFTLQSCFGHFLFEGARDEYNLSPLPQQPPEPRTVEYRIAYIALCVEYSESGRDLIRDLQSITAVDPEYVQFGCPDWFWSKQVNSYALQVEPARFRHEDRCRSDYQEALHIERIRNWFFTELQRLIRIQLIKP